MDRNEKINLIHTTGKTTEFVNTLETLITWGEKAQSSDAMDIRFGTGASDPKGACRVCSTAVQYLINTFPEFGDVFRAMYDAGTTTGCEACVDLLAYSKTLLHDIRSGTGGDFEGRQETLDQLESKYMRR